MQDALVKTSTTTAEDFEVEEDEAVAVEAAEVDVKDSPAIVTRAINRIIRTSIVLKTKQQIIK